MRRRIITLLAGLVCGASLGVAAASTITTVALTGQPAPGAEPEPYVTFAGFFLLPSEDSGDEGVFRLDRNGRTAFWAHLAGEGVVPGLNDHGYWSEGSGTLGLVGRAGDPAPGTVESFYLLGTAGDQLVLNHAGETAFLGFLPPLGDGGIWAEDGGGSEPRLVAKYGDPAPGVPGATFFGFGPPHLDHLGQTIFRASLVDQLRPFDDLCIWSEASGSLELVAREGDPAPLTEPGTTFLFLSDDPRINTAGQKTFAAALVGPSVDSTNNTGVWLYDPVAGAMLVARAGDTAPGTDPPIVFQSVYLSAYINDAGQVALGGLLVDGTVGAWAGTPGELRLVARGGNEAPGTGTSFRDVGFPFLNSLGQTAFRGRLQGPDETNDSGIWSEGGGSLELVAREGDPAPGTAVSFSDFGVSSSVGEPRLNDSGKVAFFGRLTGGVDESNDHGIWAEDTSGQLRLIMRAGDDIEVTPGNLRTVQLIAHNGDPEKHPVHFNNDGQVAFKARFTDDSEGLFIARLDEPDGDSDGVPDTEEQGPDGTDTGYDGDTSGTPDRDEPNVASLHSHDGTEYLTLASPAGTSLVDVQAIAPPEPPPVGAELPVGMLAFHIEGLPIDGTTTATLYLPSGVEPDSFWKYGPEPIDPVDHWYEFLFDETTGAEIAANLVTLHLVDGLRGDHDLVADGKVVEPGGPALTAALEVEVPLDIRPGACPNPLNVASRGVLPTAVAGHAGLDVATIDVDSIRLEGVAPLRSAIRDVTTPFWPFIGKVDAADCTTERRDGLLDLTLSFDTQAVVAQVEARLGRPIEDREVLVLRLMGNLTEAQGGNPIAGEDVVLALSKKR